MIGVLEKEVMVRNAGQPRSFHEPVLLEETIESLKPGPGKLFLMPRSGAVDIPAVCWLLVLMWWLRIRIPMRFPKY